MPFKLNYNYHLHRFFEKNIDLYFCSIIGNKLIAKLQILLAINYKNLYHLYEF